MPDAPRPVHDPSSSASPSSADGGFGTVYLVGAGPGDPGLLTLRAAELIASADALVYDALVSDAIVARFPAEAARIYVGKRGGAHTRTQDEINALLVETARTHRRVVRLKGGDPFVFGRGGEEALVLADAGVPFEVVPGVTAGVAAAAYAGIPTTQRGMAVAVTFATGHEDPTKPEANLDWDALAKGGGTLVFYMGVGKMAENFARLLAAGAPPQTPAAVVEWGTHARQRTVTGTLETLPSLAKEAAIGAPALVVVGEVVTLRDRLRWFDARPLSGRRVLVTRARAQASDLAVLLEALGAEVVQFPVIRIDDPADPAALRAAAARAGEFDWLVLTSVNGVDRFFAALAAEGRDARALGGVRVCALGPATAGALARHGVRADLVPDEFIAEGVIDALTAAGPLEGVRILLPRAEVARAVLPETLRARGAEVTEVAAYRTVPDGAGAERVRAMLARGEIHAVTFTAASTVRNFVELAGTETGGAAIASIGPVTSAAARELGLAVDVEAAEYTIPGLVAALRAHLTEGR